METSARPSTWGSIVQQRCPRCRIGRIFQYSIFRGFPKMCERCSICDLKFEREPGYFLGAMYFSFALGVLTMAPIAALLWFLTGWWITKVTIWAVVFFLPLDARARKPPRNPKSRKILGRPVLGGGRDEQVAKKRRN